MNFRTKVPPLSPPFFISHQDTIISLGSCFAQNIHDKLTYHRFDIISNPHGILFNPISIASAIEECIVNKEYDNNELGFHNELYYSFNHHSMFSGVEQSEVLSKINSRINLANAYFSKANILIVTIGTAWVYRLEKSNKVVANCHKTPITNFRKELLSVNEIVSALTQSLSKLQKFNPDIKIITTISPVRHWKDGVVENQQSKSTLHLALREIKQQMDNLVYFPSYEIMLDELRDYRFYADDMLHPSSQAIDYIWSKFSDSFFTDETRKINKRIFQIEKEKEHRLLHPKTQDSINFKEQLKRKENQLNLDFPFLK